MGSLSLLQGIFPTQGSNPGLLHCRRILYQLSHKGNHKKNTIGWKLRITSERQTSIKRIKAQVKPRQYFREVRVQREKKGRRCYWPRAPGKVHGVGLTWAGTDSLCENDFREAGLGICLQWYPFLLIWLWFSSSSFWWCSSCISPQWSLFLEAPVGKARWILSPSLASLPETENLWSL